MVDPGHPDRTFEFIYNFARRWLDNKQRSDYSQSVLKPTKTMVVKTPGLCLYRMKFGKCRDGDTCPYFHKVPNKPPAKKPDYPKQEKPKPKPKRTPESRARTKAQKAKSQEPKTLEAKADSSKGKGTRGDNLHLRKRRNWPWTD